jgi:pilus assembly protein CpaE
MGSDDLLVVDDIILKESPSLVPAVAELACRKLIIGRLSDADSARRAILLQSAAVVDREQVTGELVSAVRALFDPPPRRDPQVMAIYSAKGGVGKSTLALNLAWGLAIHSEFDVALIDCDPLGDIGAMIQDRPGATLSDLVRGLEEGMDDEVALQSVYRVKTLGLTIIPGDPNPGGAVQLQSGDLERVLRLVRSTHAYVVLDLPTGLTDINLTALDNATDIFVIAAPERVTLGTVRRSLDVLRRFYADKLVVLLNRADSDTGLGDLQIQEALGQPVQYLLPSGGSVPVRASNQGRPLVLFDPKNPLAKAIIAMTQEIVGEREGIRRRPRRWFIR